MRPVAVVISGNGAKYVRAKDSEFLDLYPGEVLFEGDRVQTLGSGAATLLFCPVGRSIDLPSGIVAEILKGEARFSGRNRDSQRSVGACEFPEVDPMQRAGEYHLGASSFDRSATPANEPNSAKPVNEREFAALLSRLAKAEKDKQEQEARAAAAELAAAWPAPAAWRARSFVHEETVAATRTASSRGHGTYAIVIGIDQFKEPRANPLKYAAADAQLIYSYLIDQRGANVPKANITTLLNSDATSSAIRDSFARVKALGADRVFVFIASHGEQAGADAYIIANDTSRQSLATSGIPMSEIYRDLTSELAGVKTVFAWIDTCHSGQVALAPLPAVPGEQLFGLAASKAYQQSFESDVVHHGYFTWFLNEALNGAIATNGGRIPTIYELRRYVEDKVMQATGGHQDPSDFGSGDVATTLASLSLRSPVPTVPGTGSPAPSGNGGAPREIDDPLLAFENQGQDVVLRYLGGEQTPVSRDDFVKAGENFASARKLAPESLWLEAREDFCAGRVAVFDKRYDEALHLLEDAIRLDPSDAVAYNALGVSLMQQAKYTFALAAFDDAIRRAPGWAYAWHNKALAYTQAGDYSSAIRAYRRAIEVAPQYFYLPYNLGVLYQSLNRRKDAEASYRKAIDLDGNRPEPYNALGTLQATEGKRADAESSFRKALALKPDFDLAQQNLDALRAQPQKRHR